MAQQALAALDRIEDPGSFRSHSLLLRGEALRALDRYREALTALQEALKYAPTNTQIHLAMGWCYKRVGQLDWAADILRRAVEEDPEEAQLHYNLACYYSLMGQRQRAIASLAIAIRLDRRYRDMACEEADFDPIRSDPDFQELASIVV